MNKIDGGRLVHDLQSGNIGVIPTDTIYGLVASALNKESVERVYRARKRNPEKPCIVLVSDVMQMNDLHVQISKRAQEVMQTVWPGPFSLIVPCFDDTLEYLHRGTQTLAFRCPEPEWLREILVDTGPIIAPSANPEGESPAETIDEARAYFKESVDFYYESGKLVGEPSTVIDLTGDEVKIIRQGAGVYKK